MRDERIQLFHRDAGSVQAARAIFSLSTVAQRNTAGPLNFTHGCGPVGLSRNSVQDSSCARTWASEPSEPHSTGPIPACGEAPTTTAPAPSEKMNAVDLSVRSTNSLARSTPITSTLRAVPPRTASEARAKARQKPAHPEDTSNEHPTIPAGARSAGRPPASDRDRSRLPRSRSRWWSRSAGRSRHWSPPAPAGRPPTPEWNCVVALLHWLSRQ